MGISVLLPLLIVVFVIFSITRNRSARQRQTQLRDVVVPGARIMTTSGLHATVVEADEGTVVLEIAPGLRTTWARAAVSRRLDDVPGTAGTDPLAATDAHIDIDDQIDPDPHAGNPQAGLNLSKDPHPPQRG